MTQNPANQSTDKEPVEQTKPEVSTNKRGLERRKKLLEVAEKHFFSFGYAGTSVNEIVKEAGGSLNTLYRYFGNKLGLFEAVFKLKTDELFTPFAHMDFWQDDIETNLFRFGECLQRVTSTPDGIAIYRLVVTENNFEQSEIQRIFYQLGPQTGIRILGDYLQRMKDKGKLDLEDPYLAASQFIEMIKGPFLYPRLFGETIEEQQLHQALKQAIHIFLNGCLQK
ncbi:TetR/AcrR family transcriptional regulator [Thiomicrorhabdus sp. 6S3-12]|uniref:TetR/AcrR family transcriptional regulator n=1 Tax=Thiomicrorhabdus sp. 6S3-12 TaxID=2819681 RepID=UPI001AACBBCC|nr:TetR/AcrR family transcriptional regulator [Thiomicrorhabdus sp. 6S3-12]MBO1924838.1 TetR/AcrR family transcriptional regulator [Thiomicrorhabdus sp. 6S3-12]